MNPKKELKNKCTDMCRLIVLKREKGKCQLTGVTKNVQVAHCYSKSACPSVQWDLDNLFLFADDAHTHFDTSNPHLFKIFAEVNLGTERFNILKLKAMSEGSPKNIRYFQELLEKLTKYYESMK